MPSSPSPLRQERLADVYARADRLARRRRTRWVTGGALASAALFVVGLAVGSDLDSSRLLTVGPASDTSSTTIEAAPSTTTTGVPAENDPSDPESPPTTGIEALMPPASDTVSPPTTPLPPTTAAPTTTSTTTCRNSRDPACGPFRYDPVPVDQPMELAVRVSPDRARAGEEVAFAVRVRDDGPASADNCINMASFGEENESVGFCTAACAPQEPQYGTWDPPEPENTSFEETFRHTYDEPGSYTATFSYNVGADCSFSPYRSEGSVSVTVEVG